MYVLQSQRLSRLYRYWATKRHDGRLPARGDIKPDEMPGLLDRLFLVDVEVRPYRFRYRLAGSALYKFAGTDLTGEYLSRELVGPNYDDIFAVHVHAVETGLPHFGVSMYERPQGATGNITVEAIFLPLAKDGRTVDMLLCTQDMLMDGWVSPAILEGLLSQRWTTVIAGEPITEANVAP